MSFTYNDSVPNPPNQPSVDVPKMQTNTNSIRSWVNVDHVDFEGPNAGTHKQVTLTPEAAPTIPAGTGAIYSYVDGSGISWPAWLNSKGQTTAMMSTISNPSSNGYTSLNGQIIVQWGSTTANSTGTTDVSFATSNINFPNNCFVVIAQMNAFPAAAFAYGVTNVSKTGFKLKTVKNTIPDGTPFYWFAIGN